MSDREFSAWLRSLPRELSQAEVDHRERFKDVTRGEYFNHHLNVHIFEESRH